MSSNQKVKLVPKAGRIRPVFVMLLLVVVVSLLAWQLYPHLVYKGYIPGKGPTSVQLPRINFVAYRPYKEKAPSIMEVAPQDMYQAFLYQYRLRPDDRFIKVFEILAERFVEYRGGPQSQSPYSVGEVLSNGKEILVPLLKKGQTVAEIRLPLPMTFSRAMSAFNEWLEIMEQGTEHPEVTAFRQDPWKELEEANTDINMVDPRYIINGLMKLDELWHEVGPEPQILRAAVRGYAMLLMVLIPDRMDYTDSLAAHALSFLAMAKRLDPKLSLASEEALLAMSMGYTAHATALLQGSFAESPDPVGRIFAAYVKQDLQALTGLQEQAPEVLGAYLLARLYRDMRLWDEAEKVAGELFVKYPALYPTIVEIIKSGDLGTAKILKVLYPLDILARLEYVMTPSSLADEKTWQERAKGFRGEESVGNISLTQFETLLDKWQPLGPDTDQGFLIDEKRVKTIFRTLYSGALYLRFNVLFDRWAVVEKAENYAQLLAAEDKDHPLVMEMLAKVYAELGRREEANAICAELIKHPNASARLAVMALEKMDDPLGKLRLAPAVAHKMDGRQQHLFLMGWVFYHLLNYDLAEKYYSLGLAQNPHWYEGYIDLAQVTGSDEPLSSAIMRFPFSFRLMEEAGDYFVEKNDYASKGKALECYDLALKLVPTRKLLPVKKAKALRQLNRYDEAVQVLKAWIEEHGQNGLTTTYYKSSLADTYLEMGKPHLAVEVVADQVASYQAAAMMVGARAYEEVGEIELAEEIYRKAVNRYPTVDHVLSGTAAFLWRQGRSKEAAAIIAQGRKSMGRFSRWYFDDFVDAFAQASEEQIIEAVDLLIEQGATAWEIGALGFHFRYKNRPEITYKIIEKAPAQRTMVQLERIVDIYKVLREWKGEEEALEYLNKAVRPQMRMPLVMVLFKDGMFDLILTELNDPESYPAAYKEFLWLQRLIAWLALQKNPADLEGEMTGHYKQSLQTKLIGKFAKKGAHDYYYDIGRYLLGMISRDELLDLVKTTKQRCEFAYYIGLSERLKTNFPEAANWYHLCQETLLQNNGEFHWASDELFWWGHMGTRNRHRLPGDDIRAYHARQLPEVQKETESGQKEVESAKKEAGSEPKEVVKQKERETQEEILPGLSI